MKILKCSNPRDAAIKANEWCEQAVTELQANKMYIPAGNTPKLLYELWEGNRPGYLEGLSLFQIDEVISSTGKGMFEAFFNEHLPTYKQQVNFINEEWSQAEIAVLGLGLNGHVAFHEPNIPRHFTFGRVELADDTCENLNIPNKSWGLSYGLGAFLNCKRILLIVCGKNKKDILQKVLDNNPDVPAAALLSHPGLTILADEAAWPEGLISS